MLKGPRRSLSPKYFTIVEHACISQIYQLSKARQSFGRDVLDLKLRCCYGQLSSFPMVTISSPAISRALLPVTSKVDKLPLPTEPVARDNS